MEGFKKASFSEKILPDTWLKSAASSQKWNVFWNFWVEIFSETRRAWTCFFEYLELIFALFFLFFVLNIQSECSCLIGFNLEDWELIWKMVVFGKGIKFFGWMNKPNKKYKSYLSGQRIWYSFVCKCLLFFIGQT